MKKLVIALLLVSISAHATPGDIGCAAKIKGKNVEILIGRDNFDEPLAFIDILVDGKNVSHFTKEDVFAGMVNVGDPEQPFLNYRYHGNNADGLVILRFPEQVEGEATAYGTIDIKKAGLSLDEVEMNCQL